MSCPTLIVSSRIFIVLTRSTVSRIYRDEGEDENKACLVLLLDRERVTLETQNATLLRLL